MRYNGWSLPYWSMQMATPGHYRFVKLLCLATINTASSLLLTILRASSCLAMWWFGSINIYWFLFDGRFVHVHLCHPYSPSTLCLITPLTVRLLFALFRTSFFTHLHGGFTSYIVLSNYLFILEFLNLLAASSNFRNFYSVVYILVFCLLSLLVLRLSTF